MKKLLQAFRHFSRWKKLAIVFLLVLILLTWLAVCLVLMLPGAP
jgi:hypothetical protein